MTKAILGSVSFVLPMYNEGPEIEQTAREVAVLAETVSDDYEIIFADDASADSSPAVIERLSREDARFRLVRLARNTKFGGALNAGLMAATKEAVIYTDSDLPVRDDDVRAMAKLLAEADVVTAYSLVIKDSSIKRIIMSKTYNFLVQTLFGLNLRDINSGFKIYKRKVLEGLHLGSRSPFIDVEIFAEAKRRGFSIKSYGLIFKLRTTGTSTISRPSVVARTFFDMIVYWIRKAWRQGGAVIQKGSRAKA